ncbi:MAG: CRISPR-associated protein Cas2 [Archaeoglobaceae archaeon]|nr:CRISPR-associated protein Cas2 [Archaeoglobaceae archaeon]MDK2876266.1 CRISPR-associated protein Cas2 [Archaeoglobaceae archaeon]
MLHLVVYDITDDGNRTRLSKLLEKFGLTRVQYSAFRGELNPNDRDVLARQVLKFIKDEHDCIFIIPLCQRCSSSAIVISNTGVELVKEKKLEIL